MGDELRSTAPKSEDVLYSTCNFASTGRPVTAPLQTLSVIARQIDQARSLSAEFSTDLMPPVNPQDISLTCEDRFGVHSLIREGFARDNGFEGEVKPYRDRPSGSSRLAIGFQNPNSSK